MASTMAIEKGKMDFKNVTNRTLQLIQISRFSQTTGPALKMKVLLYL